MRRSLRLPFSLLLLVAVLTVLASRSALHRLALAPGPCPDPQPNATLVSLASVDAGDAALRLEVEDLIEGNLGEARYRTLSIYRRQNHASAADLRIRPVSGSQIRLRSPEFRRALRRWIQNRRLQPRVMPDLADLIKRPLDRHFAAAPQLYQSCAVVGNSGILLQREYGDLIDGHDAVVRLNNARIEGYSRHVGSKTTVSFVNSNILHLCARRQGCFCHPYGDTVPIVIYICQPIHLADYMTCNSSHKSPLLVTDPRFDALCGGIVKYYSLKRFVEETGKAPEEWGKAHDEKAFHYSSGLQAVMMAVGVCRRVSVFGFGKSSEAKHHYHTNQKAELDLHDYEAEYAFYRDLAGQPQGAGD